MKAIVAICLLLSVVEGTHLLRQWRPPYPHQFPRHPHNQYPCQNFGPPGQTCPPGQVPSCSPVPPIGPTPQFPPIGPTPQFPPIGPTPSFPLPGVQLGNQNNANWYQDTSNMNSIDLNKAEWVCQNPITKDTMIIISANKETSQTGEERNPGEGSNIIKNNNHGNPNDENVKNNKHNHNANTTPQSDTNEPSRPHGGEGLIDIRLGP
ncbi:uncharacterized protein LOC144471961 [Augochlora pura]